MRAYVTGLGAGDLSVLDRYLAPGVIEHNPVMPSGAANMKAVYTGVFAQFPDLTFDVERVIGEGDLVAVHAHLVAVPGTRGQALGEIFRVKDGRIVEIWSSTQDVPETSLNTNTMF